jgi:hypothetical protein
MTEEGSPKRSCARFRGILDLNERIPQRDVRKLIWCHLNPCDREMVRCAHNSCRTMTSSYGRLIDWCVRYGYSELIQWAYEQNGEVLPWALISGRTISLAADSGSIPTLQWLKAHCDWPTHMLAKALDVAHYAIPDTIVMHFDRDMRESDYLTVVHWLAGEGLVVGFPSEAYALRRNFFYVMDHLLTVNRIRLPRYNLPYMAAQMGNIRALEIIRQHQTLDYSSIRIVAAEAGQRHVTEWADKCNSVWV